MSLADADSHSLAKQLPDGLLDNIVRLINPRRVFLIGSQARGTPHADSDWDLLLVLDDDTKREQVGWQVMGAVRKGISGAVDLIPFRESNFRKRADVVGSLPWIAMTEGVIVYERLQAA